MSKAVVDCRFFTQGHCARGESCLFRHCSEARDNDAGVCEAWQAAQCSDVHCPYKHPQEQFGAASRSLCIYFMHGRCRNGDACQFYHPARRRAGAAEQSQLAEGESGSVANLADEERKEPAPDHQPVVTVSDTKRKAADILSKYSSSRIGRDMHVPVKVKRRAAAAAPPTTMLSDSTRSTATTSTTPAASPAPEAPAAAVQTVAA